MENRRRLPVDEQLQILEALYIDVMSGKHSIGQSRRAKALKKEMTVLKRKLGHHREGICGMAIESGLSLERGSVLVHHGSGGTGTMKERAAATRSAGKVRKHHKPL